MLSGTTDKPNFPLNLIADFAGGGLLCANGILLALIERGRSGRGQIVNVDMVRARRMDGLVLQRQSLGFRFALCFLLPAFGCHEQFRDVGRAARC